MATGIASWPAIWALALSALAVLTYVLYQLLGFRLLRRSHERLRALRGCQRQVYRRLEVLQRRSEELAARVPHAIRPAPYASDDSKAIATHRALRALLEGLRQRLRPLDVGPYPQLALTPFLTNSYWLRLRAAAAEVAFGEGQERELAQAEALADELEAILAGMARKPLEVERGLADLQILAEALAQELAREEQRGTEGLAPLVFDIQAVRASALAALERLRATDAAEVAQVAIEAEALRPQMLDRLAELQARAERVAGMHDQALGGQERLAQALAATEAQVAALRPVLAEAVRPALESLQKQRQTLAARYREHDLAAYQDVVQQAWMLLAQARSLEQRIGRLAEADVRGAQAIAECRRAVADLRQRVEEECEQSRVDLDLSQTALKRAEQCVAQLESLWALEPQGKGPLDLVGATTVLGQAEVLAARCRHEYKSAWEALSAWQARRRRIDEILTRLDAAAADHERLSWTWQELQRFHRANWSQVDAGWYDTYARTYREIMGAAYGLRSLLSAGQAKESASGDLQSQCEALEQRWRGLLHEGQGIISSLGRAQAAQRQVLEGLSALRPDVQTVAAVEEEIPPGMASAKPLHQLSNDILTYYRSLEDEALRPERADYRRLRDEKLVRLREQLANHRLSYARLLEAEWSELKRRLLALWEQWQPLNQRLEKAVPASGIDRQRLEKRWDALAQAGHSTAKSLKQIAELMAQADLLAQDVAAARSQFDAERKAVRDSEQRLASTRAIADRWRGYLPTLLRYPHPRVVGEEWDRSTKAWRKSEGLLRVLEPHRGVGLYVARMEEAAKQYEEAGVRARSAFVRLLRYAFLEDPDGLHEACLPLGPAWGSIGVTAREEHIRELMADLERAGEVGRLVERVEGYYASRNSASG